MSIVELAIDTLKAFSKTSNTPLHAGEVMNLWTFLTATENFTNSEQITLNKVKDKDLSDKMNELINNYHKPIIQDIKNLLLKEGIELPQEPVEKPQIKLDVQDGAKMTDEEVANLVVFNLVWAIKFCSRGLTESVRADVGEIFLKAIMKKASFSVTFKELLSNKGWLKTPPLFKNGLNK